MKPPGAPAAGKSAIAARAPPAVCVSLGILRKRADFLKAAKSTRRSTPGFMVQARKRELQEQRFGTHVGYTCSKKVGNAVARNRAKRRLREVARAVLPQHGHDGWDYVLIGRADATASRPLDQMIADLQSALSKLHQNQP